MLIAGREDVAFFDYAGYGSCRSPKSFGLQNPEPTQCETLVCYDSRSPSGWDLADKELAKLIAEVAQKDPHITIIMDCCHSSSGTRGEIELRPVERVKLLLLIGRNAL